MLDVEDHAATQGSPHIATMALGTLLGEIPTLHGSIPPMEQPWFPFVQCVFWVMMSAGRFSNQPLTVTQTSTNSVTALAVFPADQSFAFG